ncbi:MAG TPA: type II toxin-antitoxin system RelE/ParE family toxin [Pirellulaceae bacterium]|nr:type II toxin-antitoxin system RelE/ParE family toxin [Pirellulaceae bacterium]
MAEFRLSKQAQADLVAIWDYLARRSLAAADRQIDELIARFEFLAGTPVAGTLRDDLKRGLRLFSAGNYVIFFYVISSGVEIAGVIHGSRDYETMYLLGDR